jgi:hypothetical protein
MLKKEREYRKMMAPSSKEETRGWVRWFADPWPATETHGWVSLDVGLLKSNGSGFMVFFIFYGSCSGDPRRVTAGQTHQKKTHLCVFHGHGHGFFSSDPRPQV